MFFDLFYFIKITIARHQSTHTHTVKWKIKESLVRRTFGVGRQVHPKPSQIVFNLKYLFYTIEFYVKFSRSDFNRIPSPILASLLKISRVNREEKNKFEGNCDSEQLFQTLYHARTHYHIFIYLIRMSGSVTYELHWMLALSRSLFRFLCVFVQTPYKIKWSRSKDFWHQRTPSERLHD